MKATLRLLLLLLSLHLVSAQEAGKGDVTRYACEGKTLSLSCPSGQVLDIKLANFGRFSVSICNDAGHLNLNLQCMDKNSINLVREKCQEKRRCSLDAVLGLFSDGCPDTPKYLQVQYSCIQPPPAPATLPPPAIEETSPVPETSEAPTTSQRPEPVTQEPSEPRAPTEAPELFCPSVSRRRMSWHRTEAGHEAKAGCPNNPRHFGLWACGSDGAWQGSPDLSRCAAPWAEELLSEAAEISETKDSIRLAKACLNRAASQRLLGGDTAALAQVLQASVSGAADGLAQMEGEERSEAAEELSSLVVAAASELLKPSQAWSDLPRPESTRTGAELLAAVEQNAELLADSRAPEAAAFVQNEARIGLEIVRVGEVEDYVRLPSQAGTKAQGGGVQLPPELFKGDTESRLIFASIRGLGERMEPEEKERTVASDVITAAVAGQAMVRGLRHPVKISLPLRRALNASSNPTCVWWEKTSGNNPGEGRWSNSGCRLAEVNSSHALCHCDHLTSFAILMDVDGDDYSGPHHIILSFVTYTGCVVSIVCLSLSVCAFGLLLVVGSGSRDRLFIHINLCLCLLGAELLFIFGVPQTGSGLACSIIATGLHYLFLAAFAWMALEGFQLYAMLVEVFEAERSRVPLFLLFGYGFPALVVGISAGVDWASYGTREFCWLAPGSSAMLAFLIPVGLILAVNAFFLLMGMGIMCRHTSLAAAPHRHCQHKGRVERVGAWLRGAAVLFVLLGLTWALGLLNILLSSRLIDYAFTVANTLQGLFIFLFHVLWNEKVRKEYENFVRRSSWLPDWIRSSALESPSSPTSPKGSGASPGVKALLSSSSSSGSPRHTAASSLLPNSSLSNSQPYLTKSLGRRRAERSCEASAASAQALLTHQAFFDPLRSLDDGYAYAQDLSASSAASDEATDPHIYADPNDPDGQDYLPSPPSFPPPLPPYYDVRPASLSHHSSHSQAAPSYAPIYQPGCPAHKLLLVGQPRLDTAFDAPPDDGHFRLPASASTLPREGLHLRPSLGVDSAYGGRGSSEGLAAEERRRLSSTSPESGLHSAASSSSHSQPSRDIFPPHCQTSQPPPTHFHFQPAPPSEALLSGLVSTPLERPELPVVGGCLKPTHKQGIL